MIKYKLICKDCNHCFDSWFSTSNEYERLKKKNIINCLECNSFNVEKTLMSPSILCTQDNAKIEIKNKKYKEIKKKTIEYQNFVKENFDYVGENFTYEARSIHYKNKKTSKSIYGVATEEDLKELKEEGIETKTIPWIEDFTN